MMKKLSFAEKYKALAEDCERRARECERQMLNPDLSDAGQRDQTEAAKVYWQLARDHIETSMRVDAERGKVVADAQKEAAAITNARHAPLRMRRFARLKDLMPRFTLQSAAAICENEGLGKADTIVRQWNRHKTKRSDT